MISSDERTTREDYFVKEPHPRLSCGSDVNAEITVREEVCSSRSPEALVILCLLLVFATPRAPNDDISDEGCLDDKADVSVFVPRALSPLRCTRRDA